MNKQRLLAALTLSILILSGCGKDAPAKEQPVPADPPETTTEKAVSPPEEQPPQEQKPGYRDHKYDLAQVKQALEKKYLNFNQTYLYEGEGPGGSYNFVSKAAADPVPPVQINPYTGNYFDLKTGGYVDTVLTGDTPPTPVDLQTLNQQLEKATFLHIQKGDKIQFATYLQGDALYKIQYTQAMDHKTLRINLATGDIYDFETDQWVGGLKP